jgi:hypothetical protein
MFYKSLEEFMEQNGYVIDGKWYPRVTSIVQIKSKPALYKFYGEAESFNHALSITGKSATTGTKIHTAIEKLLIGEMPELDEETKPAIQAFQDFMSAHTIEVDPNLIERRIFHPEYKYAGTVDAFATIDGIFGILDIKTSSSIWRDYHLQTVAYFAASQNENCLVGAKLPQKPQTRWILRIDTLRQCKICGAKMRQKGGVDRISGGFDLCEHYWTEPRGEWELKDLSISGDFESDFKAFLAAKTLWEWEHHYWLSQIIY